MAIQHQYIERQTGKVCTEPLFWDRTVHLMYTELREHAPTLFRALVGPYVSRLFGCINFDLPLTRSFVQFLTSCSVSLDECLEKPEKLNTARKLF
jgi:phosphatidylserine decarboxylase